MAQSSRGALETWRESSALLAVFCSTAESPGPRSSLANCCVPPRTLCAIKDNCANDVRHGNASPLRQTEVNLCSSRKCPRRHILAATKRSRDECGTRAVLHKKGCSKMNSKQQNFFSKQHANARWSGCQMCGSGGEMGLGGSAGSGEERVNKVQLVLTSRSTRIAPEGGCCIYQASQNIHMHARGSAHT